jgi:alpha-glucosidase (family GH31 glycosyl hydrolase)
MGDFEHACCMERGGVTLVVLLALVVANAATTKVTLTPWCANSMRVRVAPTLLPPGAEAAAAALKRALAAKNMTDLAGAMLEAPCSPGPPLEAAGGSRTAHDNLAATVGSDGSITFARVDTGAVLFSATATFAYNDDLATASFGYFTANLTLTPGPGSRDEVVYGLGQGNWTGEGGCPSPAPSGARIVPLERNGQRVDLQQRKFHVSIPFTYSTAGYGFLFNMPGYGEVSIGAHGVGGAQWSQQAALYVDFWVAALPKNVAAPSPTEIYTQYADATGHAPPLRATARGFWQSRNRYKSSAIALGIAQRYEELKVPVGVLVIDYKNQVNDGDWAPNPACYPSVKELVDGVHSAGIPELMFSFWPEVTPQSAEYDTLRSAGCLINADLGGFAFDATIPGPFFYSFVLHLFFCLLVYSFVYSICLLIAIQSAASSFGVRC